MRNCKHVRYQHSGTRGVATRLLTPSAIPHFVTCSATLTGIERLVRYSQGSGYLLVEKCWQLP